MTAKELIERLSAMPPDAVVGIIYDGEMRGDTDLVWLTQGGEVAIADYRAKVYSTSSRPIGAPTKEQAPYWTAPAPLEER